MYKCSKKTFIGVMAGPTATLEPALGPALVQASVLEAPLGLDVIQDLLQLLVLKATLQTEHTC